MKIDDSFLSRYNDILNGNRYPGYLQCKNIPISFSKNESLEELWKLHHHALNDINIQSQRPLQSLLDLKILIAERIYQDCTFCEHRCQINREREVGQCNISTTRIASAFLHHGEESFLVPSYTLFFSGCNLNCLFCQNYDISQQQTGRILSPTQLADFINNHKKNARNINWVGGEPTPHLLFILKTLNECETKLPQVWNSNMYCSDETMNLLHGVVDFYLTDFKFGNNHCAQSLSGVKNYDEIVKRNHHLARTHADICIRHLLLPNHINCCSIPILDFIKENIPGSIVHLMDQYHPTYQSSKYPSLNRLLFHDEKKTAIEYAKKLSLPFLS